MLGFIKSLEDSLTYANLNVAVVTIKFNYTFAVKFVLTFGYLLYSSVFNGVMLLCQIPNTLPPTGSG